MSAGGRPARLLAVWLLLPVLVGTIVILERTDLFRRQPWRDGHRSAAVHLLPVSVDQLGALEVIHGRALHRFERDAAGAWFYHLHGADTASAADHTHDADPAVAERIAHVLAAFGRTRIERRLALQPHAADYGVTTPTMLILLYQPHAIQPLAQYAIGDIAPDALSRYVLVVGSATVVTIPNYQIDNVLGLIEAVADPAAAGQATRSLP